jgi:hypothetical protein
MHRDGAVRENYGARAVRLACSRARTCCTIVCKLGAEVMQTFDDVEQTKILQRCMRSP